MGAGAYELSPIYRIRQETNGNRQLHQLRRTESGVAGRMNRYWIGLLLLLAWLPSPAAARQAYDWRPLATSYEAGGGLLVDSTFSPVGAKRKATILYVFLKPQTDGKGPAFDRQQEVWSIDCKDMRYWIEEQKLSLGRKDLPPPIFRQPDQGYAADPNSLASMVVDVACGTVPLAGESIVDIQAWLRASVKTRVNLQ